MGKNALKGYAERRDFSKTPEPAAIVKKRKNKKPIFVIQQHDASHMHYDFRLEIDGVLVSWAIPKGPSTNPSLKRLAIQTEDHPLDYADFEGVIPEGQYGAGTVMVWDTGTYENLKDEPMQTCLKNGKIEIFLHGHKLQGAYVLIQRSFDDSNQKKEWLFFKMKDEYVSKQDIIKKKPKSALTGRTLEQIAKDETVYEG